MFILEEPAPVTYTAILASDIPLVPSTKNIKDCIVVSFPLAVEPTKGTTVELVSFRVLHSPETPDTLIIILPILVNKRTQYTIA
jgi:hypothetical protein